MTTNKQGFAERLLEARMRYGIGVGRVVTQSELAKALGVSPQAWSSWESGGSEPGFDMVKRIAKLLDASPAQLAFGETDGTTPHPTIKTAPHIVAGQSAKGKKKGA